jgi:hypothetical protein
MSLTYITYVINKRNIVLFDTQPFYENINEEFMDIISVVSDKEVWPTDKEPDVELIIEQVNAVFPRNIEKLSSLSASVCLGLLAVLSLPRSIRMLQVIGNEAPIKIKEITSLPVINDEEAKTYFSTLMNRLELIMKINLLSRVYSKERRALVMKYILEGVNNEDV